MFLEEKELLTQNIASYKSDDLGQGEHYSTTPGNWAEETLVTGVQNRGRDCNIRGF